MVALSLFCHRAKCLFLSKKHVFDSSSRIGVDQASSQCEHTFVLPITLPVVIRKLEINNA